MFELVSNYVPSGNQPKAIEELTAGIKKIITTSEIRITITRWTK